MEQLVNKSASENFEELDLRGAKADKLMQEANAQMDMLKAMMEPWAERRKNIEKSLAVEIEQFIRTSIDRLTRQMTAIDRVTSDLARQKEEIEAAIGDLGHRRRGLKAYTKSSPQKAVWRKKA